MDTCVFHSGDAYLIEQSSSIYPSSQVHSQGRLCCRWRLIIVHTCVYRECYWLWQHRCSRCLRWLDSRMYKSMPSTIHELGMAARRCAPEAGKTRRRLAGSPRSPPEVAKGGGKTKGKATTLCYWPAGPPSNNSVLLTGVRRRPGSAEKCKHGKPSRPEAYF